jgi:hypothetical protein
MLAMLIAGLGLGLWWMGRSPVRSPWTCNSGGLTLERVRALADLVTVRAEVADVQETSLAGYTGSIRAALLIRGELLVGVDLSRATFEQKDEIRHTAVLSLPAPHVLSARLDHQRTRIFGITTRGLWLIAPGGQNADAAVINRAYREAQVAIERTAMVRDIRERAKTQAEKVLCEFSKSLGWELEVKWGD